MMRFIHHSKQTGDPLAFLLTGPPGVGKTELSRWAVVQREAADVGMLVTIADNTELAA